MVCGGNFALPGGFGGFGPPWPVGVSSGLGLPGPSPASRDLPGNEPSLCMAGVTGDYVAVAAAATAHTFESHETEQHYQCVTFYEPGRIACMVLAVP